MPPLHPEVARVVASYVERVGDLVEGLYLHGSVALGDYRPGRSDIDFVAVTTDRLTSEQVSLVERAHAELSGPHFDGVYLTWGELALGPAIIGPTPCVHQRRFSAAGVFEHNPVTWHTLAQAGVTVHGAELSGRKVWTDPVELAAYQRANLRGYWSSWLADRERAWYPGMYLRSGVSWGVLGVPRLHHTLATGGILSKTAAGEYALSTFGSRWHRVIREAMGRRAAQRSLYREPVSRRRDALGFVRVAIDDALGTRS